MEMKVNAPNVLIVDDEIGPRESLRMILKPNYNIYTADNGHKAIEMIQQIRMDVVTLDLKMPEISGIDTLKEIRHLDPEVMVIVITGFGTLKTAIEAIRYGVFDYIPKPFNVPEIIAIIGKSVQRKKLNTKIKEVISQVSDHPLLDDLVTEIGFCLPKEMNGDFHSRCRRSEISENGNCLEFARVLAYTLEENDPYTSGHSARVCYYSDLIAKRLCLSAKEQVEVQIASYLHDIGKMGISNRFINKKGTLTPADWAIMKQHTKKSIELLVPLSLSSNILSYILHHHERFDGTGYPDGLARDQIPLGARIIAISDAYDSMTSNRPYRQPLSNGEAKKELSKCAGSQFDPKLVTLFSESLDEVKETFLMRDPFNVAQIVH
jgi:response regulator RpfG family c-di-GMP phosphodiesterase